MFLQIKLDLLVGLTLKEITKERKKKERKRERKIERMKERKKESCLHWLESCKILNALLCLNFFIESL